MSRDDESSQQKSCTCSLLKSVAICRS